MEIALPFDEAMSLVGSWVPLPAFVLGVRCEGSTLKADVDLRSIPATSSGMRLALAAAGTVLVTARLSEFTDGVATFAFTAHARGLPAHRLLHLLVDPIAAAIKSAGFPEGVLHVQRGDSATMVALDVQRVIASKTDRLTVTRLELTDGVMHLGAAFHPSP